MQILFFVSALKQGLKKPVDEYNSDHVASINEKCKGSVPILIPA